MELVKVTSSSDPLLNRFPELYESSFPDVARVESRRFLSLIENCEAMTFNAVVEEDEFKGMAVIWQLDGFCYFQYLAILEEFRNQGLGKRVLAKVFSEYPHPIIGEVEPPVTDMQKRRLAFYGRNGLYMEMENPTILNNFHSNNPLCLVSTEPLDDAEFCQRQVIDKVYCYMDKL